MAMKQVILVRKDLKLPKGKLAAQVAHASVEAAYRSSDDDFEAWKEDGSKKVVVYVKDLKEILHYQNMAKQEKLVASLITDAGRTVVAPGTITCLGIGPGEEEKIDKVTKGLKMV